LSSLIRDGGSWTDGLIVAVFVGGVSRTTTTWSPPPPASTWRWS